MTTHTRYCKTPHRDALHALMLTGVLACYFVAGGVEAGDPGSDDAGTDNKYLGQLSTNPYGAGSRYRADSPTNPYGTGIGIYDGESDGPTDADDENEHEYVKPSWDSLYDNADDWGLDESEE